MAAPSAIRRSASPRFLAPQTNGGGKGVLVDVVRFIRGGKDLRFVDKVDPERLQNLGFGEVANAGLGHHRDGGGRP